MTIQDLNAIKSNTIYVINNLDNESKENAKKIETLFAQKFYNGGAGSADAIANEIATLQNYIAQKQAEIADNYALLKATSGQLNALNDQLQDEIYEVTQQADVAERTQRLAINKAIDEVNEAYMKGDIDKEDMSSELTAKISMYCGIDEGILEASLRLNNTKAKIEALTTKIAYIIDVANGLEMCSKTAQGTLLLMSNLMGKMNLGVSNSATAANERPIYTPTKQALVDTLAMGIRGMIKTDGAYISWSEARETGVPCADHVTMANPQMVELKNFLGMNGDGALDGRGVLADSMLLQMKDAGFTSKEALYAISWIFDKCSINYTPGGAWSVPYGHDAEARGVYNELIGQVKTLWGKDAVMSGEEIPDGSDIPGGDIPGGDIPGGGGTTDDGSIPVDDPSRTDPIGYSIGDVTYEFVLDRNHDSIFNDKSEFLGAQGGINELIGLDLNNDGIVSSSELSINENLFVLVTDHKTGEHSFVSAAEGGIDSIDLSTITSANWTNINDNQLKNIFAVNTVYGTTVQGYQTDDSNFYIQKSYNGVDDASMAVKVDASAMAEAQNIFNSIETMSCDAYAQNLVDASKDTRNAQVYVSFVADEMEDTYGSADGNLYRGVRPETPKERMAREAKEAEERAAEQKRLEKIAQEKAARQAEEAKKAETKKQAEEDKKAEEAKKDEEAKSAEEKEAKEVEEAKKTEEAKKVEAKKQADELAKLRASFRKQLGI